MSFSKCAFTFPETAAEKIEELAAQTKSFDAREEALKSDACALAPYLKDWKIFSDYLSLQLEKAEAYDSFFKTASTFTLHGYVPPGGMRFRARGNRCGHARRGDGIYRTDRGRYAANAFEKPRAREKRGIRHKYVFRAPTTANTIPTASCSGSL